MRIFLLALVILSGCTVSAQPGSDYSIKDKKAIKLYEAAVEGYEQRMLDDALANLKLAREKSPEFVEPYILAGQILNEQGKNVEAIDMLRRAQQVNPTFYPPNNYFLGELELREGMYNEAHEHFSIYLAQKEKKDISWERATLGQASCEFAVQAMANPVDFNPINLGPAVNSEGSEYYPCMTVDEKQLLLTREVKDPRAPEGVGEDFYMTERSTGDWEPAFPLSTVNTPLREGAPSLSPDGQTLIFTACEMFGDYGPGRQGWGSCDLFVSQRVGGEWSAVQNLGSKVNSRNWESQPSFSADGRSLFFVRGKRGPRGIQEQDIYKAVLQEDGQWSQAKPIEGAVNTRFEEESVLIHPDGQTLYFSSNGHPGMGGLDIYLSRLQPDGTWGEPVNLGYPINTNGSENSLLVSARGEVAIFASDREGGYGGLDLYSFELPEEVRPQPVTYTRGVVLDAKSFKKLGARFELVDLETGQLVAESYSDERTGEFLVPLPVNRNYALNVNRKGYLFHSEHFKPEATADGKPYELEVLLHKIRPESKTILNNIFFESAKFDLLPASEVELDNMVGFLQENATVVVAIEGHTDNVGGDEDNRVLSQNRAKAVVDYLVEKGIEARRLRAEGFGEDQPIETNETEAGRAKNRRTEFRILSL